MTLLRLTRPRQIVSFALEGGLTFVVLYALAAATTAVVRGLNWPIPASQIAALSLLFVACVAITRGTRAGDESNLRREVALASIVSLSLGLVAFMLDWAYRGTPQAVTGFLMLEGAIAVPAVVACWRWTAARLNVLDGWRERVLVLGTGDSARRLCHWISHHLAADYVVVGFADETDTRVGQVLSMGVRIQTNYDALTRYCPHHADRILVALDEKRGKLPLEPLMELRLAGLEIEDVTSFIERTSGKLAVETMLPSWLIFSDGFKISPLRLAGKRLLDVVFSLFLLVVSLPVALLMAILIRLDSRGPVLYRQRRMGSGGREFVLLKFRSMVQDAEGRSGPTWARAHDPRVTRVGRILRKLRIDETPQLLNVLRGEMSFVGPRPERKHFVEQLERRIPYYRLRMAVRPGITGWAQVQYQYAASEEDALEKLKYDLYYIKNCNALFDLWIALKTVKVVLLGVGAR
ncbi:MAG: TIGR03013 family PEP-CTERM/XrtA system glycosyltransferase [Acidobacteriia bacterium]|nr:TIGR03013 family PEP-CTERM/XrtA system glycosyltransferase [Terriglobia bacterium]